MLPSPEDRLILHKRGGKVFKPENRIKPWIALVPIPVQVNSYSHLLARNKPVLSVPHGSRHSEEGVHCPLSPWMGNSDGIAALSGGGKS